MNSCDGKIDYDWRADALVDQLRLPLSSLDR
jgi:hypothetical protein